MQHLPAVQIVPVGLHYENHTAFRSRVLVNFGSPISISKNYFDENPVQQTELLLKTVADKLTPLILSIPESNYYDTWRRLQDQRQYQANIATQLQHEQQLVNTPSTTAIHKTKGISFLQKLFAVIMQLTIGRPG
ncbi:MAG: hypothetical protein HWD62_07775 [Cyclobacteriaceae bacterium]|nr:MAG: hypothetical protein HWD62_07775 [Cyclobacteriaceae bacterium]